MSTKHKRILIAEPSETIRSVAESALRQHGYEVISVATAEQTVDVLQYSVPDLMIISGDLQGSDSRPLFERIQADSRWSSIPLLLFDAVESGGLPFPTEVILSRPLDSDDLIRKVRVFTGEEVNRPSGEEALAGAELDDNALDEALGLDRIDVEASEELDQTKVSRFRKSGKQVEKMVGLDHEVNSDDEVSDSRRVEIRRIDETGKLPVSNEKERQSDTGGLELIDDQYGMLGPEPAHPNVENGAHDYNWFVNSMREEVSEPPPGDTSQQSSDKLDISRTSSHVDPVTPPPASTAAQSGKQAVPGVEKFIDEFREEMERIHTNEVPEVVSVKPDEQPQPAGEDLNWEETLEKVSIEDVRAFSTELANALADRLASKILAKIDSEKLLKLIAGELARHLASRKQGQPQK